MKLSLNPVFTAPGIFTTLQPFPQPGIRVEPQNLHCRQFFRLPTRANPSTELPGMPPLLIGDRRNLPERGQLKFSGLISVSAIPLRTQLQNPSDDRPFSFVPEEIRLYFGEAIALYFTFLGYYTATLVVPVLLGLLQLIVYSDTMSFFCVFNVVWVTLVLEVRWPLIAALNFAAFHASIYISGLISRNFNILQLISLWSFAGGRKYVARSGAAVLEELIGGGNAF